MSENLFKQQINKNKAVQLREKLVITGESAMLKFGADLAQQFKPGEIIFLHGDLGAGKTTLTRGFLQGLDYHGRVKSPTFAVVEEYPDLAIPVYHFDLYRMTRESSVEELELLGLRDYLSNNVICIFEWPTHGIDVLPNANWYIEINNGDTNLESREVLVYNLPSNHSGDFGGEAHAVGTLVSTQVASP